MNISEAKEILSKHFSAIKKSSYSELRGYLNPDPFTVREFTGLSGRNYKISIQSSWVDRKDGSLRIRISIDDGDLSYFFPLSDEFILSRSGHIVGNRSFAPTTNFRIPRRVSRALTSIRELEYKKINIWNLFYAIVLGIGLILFIGYFSSKHTMHGDEDSYAYTSGVRLGLYEPILAFQKYYSRWPKDKDELQNFVEKEKIDVSLRPFQKLVFKQNEDGSLTVIVIYKAVSGIESGSFILKPPRNKIFP